MIRAFRMKLFPGVIEEYKRRHDEIWPEMLDMLRAYGASDYSIYHDPETDCLFGILELQDPQRFDESAQTEICRKWWDYMADLMETNPDKSPISRTLDLVFHMD